MMEQLEEVTQVYLYYPQHKPKNKKKRKSRHQIWLGLLITHQAGTRHCDPRISLTALMRLDIYGLKFRGNTLT